MEEYIMSYMVIPIEMLCCNLFYGIFCNNKKIAGRIRRILFWLIMLFLTVATDVFLGGVFVLKEIFIINIIAIMMKIYLGITYKKSYVLAMIYQCVILVAELVTILIDKTTVNALTSNSYIVQSVVIILSKLVLFIIVIFLKKIFAQNRMEYFDDVGWLKFVFIPIISICLIITILSNDRIITDDVFARIIWMLALGIVGMNIVLFYFIQDAAVKEKQIQEKRILEIESEKNLRLYESVSESLESQRRLSHEYRNQLVCIQSLLGRKEYDGLSTYMEKLTGDVLHDLDYIDANNPLINAILNEKYRQASEKGIVMVYKINDMSDIKMEEQDIVLILSNLLNNAMEACLKCNGSRIIRLKAMYEDNELTLSVQNTYDGNVDYADGEYHTTKETDSDNHGIGIRNIIKVIDKYNGYYSISHSEKEFSFSIIIPE